MANPGRPHSQLAGKERREKSPFFTLRLKQVFSCIRNGEGRAAALGEAETKEGNWYLCLEGDLGHREASPSLPGSEAARHTRGVPRGLERGQGPWEGRCLGPWVRRHWQGGCLGRWGFPESPCAGPCIFCISPFRPLAWAGPSLGYCFSIDTSLHLMDRDCLQMSLILTGGTHPLHAFSAGLSWAQVTQGLAEVARHVVFSALVLSSCL